jgi:hypothetical protein
MQATGSAACPFAAALYIAGPVRAKGFSWLTDQPKLPPASSRQHSAGSHGSESKSKQAGESEQLTLTLVD